MEKFIEQYRESIASLMQYDGIFDADQGDIEDYILNNEELFNLAIKEGVEI